MDEVTQIAPSLAPSSTSSPAWSSGRRLPTWWPTAVLGALMVVGLVIRLIGIGLPPLTFHANRQLIDAMMSRGYWLDLGGSLPAGIEGSFTPWTPPFLEPPVVQGMGAFTFLVSGGEHLWLIRSVLAVAWVLVTPAVVGLGRRLCGRTAGLAAAVVWLFLPYGVAVSRSFQPDGLMVCLVVLALWAFVRADDDPQGAGWMGPLLGAAAVIVKPTAALAVLPALAALAWLSGGWRGLARREVALRAVVVVAPAAVYWGLASGLGALPEGDGRFTASAWLDLSYWTGWWQMADRVVGALGAVVALFGLLVAPRRMRVLGAALLGGYVLHGLAFSHHTPTHDYYHLLAVPPLLLGVGSAAQWANDRVRVAGGRKAAGAGAAAMVCALVLLAVPRPYPYVETGLSPSLRAMVDASAVAGEAMAHNERVLFVARGYGVVQQYYGYLGGSSWPLQGDLDVESVFGVEPKTAAQRLRTFDEGGRIEWMMIAEPAVLTEQPDLAQLLRDQFDPVVEGEGWTAYRRR